jgi:hypothetical protein
MTVTGSNHQSRRNQQWFETDPFYLLAPHAFANETGVSCERDRRFESVLLQRGVNCEPVRAGGIQPGPCAAPETPGKCRLVSRAGKGGKDADAQPRRLPDRRP